jgi:zinc and cadmium transporter
VLLVLLFSLIGGLLSLSGALILFRNDKQAKKIALYATPFAAGVLLASAFTDLLPESMEEAPLRNVLLAALLGMIGFFFLERYVRVFHHHHDHGKKGKKNDQSQNSLIIIGDTLHNTLDGLAIGAAFLIDPSTGIIAAIAVAAHEIPQEIGDFGLLIKNGMEKRKVILVNALSALATTVAAVSIYAIGDIESEYIPYLLAITAGFFIYIAASDIIPEIHESNNKNDIRPWLLLLGAVFIMIVSPIAHEYIDAGHEHEHSVTTHDNDQEHTDEMHEEGDEHHEHDEEKHEEDDHL